MGKAALLAVVMTTMTLAFANSTREESALNKALVDSDYQDEVVSRQAAQSAFNIVISQVKKDFENYRGSVTDKSFDAAGYEYSAVDGDTPDEVVVTAKGILHNHEYEIVGTVAKEYRVLDSITLDAQLYESKNKKEIYISNKALISGHDTNPDGSTGSNSSVYGLLVTSDESYKSVKTGTGSSKMIGKGIKNSSENKSLMSGDTPSELDTIGLGITDYSGSGLHVMGGNQTFSGTTTIGSLANPVVYRVNGDVTLTDNVVGYGILYVNGDFVMKDDTKWYGLIYMWKDGGKFEMDNRAELHGAAVARSVTTIGSGNNAGGPMELYIREDARIMYSSYMLKLLSGMVPELEQTDQFEFTVERNYETPERVGWVLSLRDMEAFSTRKLEYQKEQLLQGDSFYEKLRIESEKSDLDAGQ